MQLSKSEYMLFLKHPAWLWLKKRFLMLGIAWRWQADQLGGLSPALARRLAALTGKAAGDGAPPAPGTRLIREWQSVRYELHVTERGYLCRGERYRSLSGVAKAITGAHRNGPAFFGLRAPKPPAS